MQVREEQLALAHTRILRRDRLLHFHNHLSGGPNLVSGTHHRRSGAFVQRIVKARTFAGVNLDSDVVSGIFERAHAGWSQSDSIFVVFNLFGQTNNHSFTLRELSEMMLHDY